MSELHFPRQLALCRSTDVLGGAWYITAECPSFPLHVEPNELEMNLVVAGSLRARAGDAEFELGPGDLLWLAQDISTVCSRSLRTQHSGWCHFGGA